MLRRMIIPALLCLAGLCAFGKSPAGIAFCDVDRLYDTLPALFYDDSEYTPEGRLKWNSARYERKVRQTAALIDSMGLDIVALWGVENEQVVRDIAQACRGDYAYIHRTLNSLDGMDFALLYYGDRFYPGRVETGRRYLRIENDQVEAAFDMHNGQLITLRYDGQEMLHRQQGPVFNGYRSINNDPRDWQNTVINLKSFQYALSADKRSVEVTTVLEAHVGNTVVPHTVIYTVHAGGAVDVKADFHASEDFRLPRLALQTMFSPSLENVEWYGRGPIENYRDRNAASFVGLYKSTVSDMREYYVRAQSMGGRTDTRWLSLTDDSGKGVRITADGTFDFSALHYTDPDLWRIKYGHDIDLVRRAEVVLNLDCIQRGIGNASCGPQPLPEYEIKSGTDYSYTFRIEPAGGIQ